MASCNSDDASAKVNPLYTSIPIIQRVMSFTPSKKLSTPIKLATVCSSWEETCKVYGGGSLVWLHEAEKNNKKSAEKLVCFLHKACAASNDVCSWVVKQLLQLGVVDPTAVDRAGFQGIHFASRYGNKKVFDILLFHHLLYPNAYQDRQLEIASNISFDSNQQNEKSSGKNENDNNNNNNNPQKIVSMYAVTTKSNYTIIDLAAETAQKAFIEFLILERNYNPARNTSANPTTECENAVSHLLKEWDSAYFITMMTAFKKKWDESPILSESELHCCEVVEENEEDPRYKMQQLGNDEQQQQQQQKFSNNNDDVDDNEYAGLFLFTRSASNIGYIETNNDDKELARLVSPQFYDSFAAVKKVKRTFKSQTLHMDGMFTTTIKDRFQTVHRCMTPLLAAVIGNKHAAIAYILDTFPESSDVFQVNVVTQKSIFFYLIESCKYTFKAIESSTETKLADVNVESVVGNIIIKLMEKSNQELLKLKIKKIKDEDENENDDNHIDVSRIFLEPEEKIIERRLIPGDESTPTPFLVGCRSSSGRSGVGLMQFLIAKCGANPLALTKTPLPPSSAPNNTNAAVATAGVSNEVAKQSYFVEDALFFAWSTFRTYTEQGEILSMVKFLVSEGCDPYKKTGIENIDLFDRVEQKIKGDTTPGKTGAPPKVAKNSIGLMEAMKQAVQDGVKLKNERLQQ